MNNDITINIEDIRKLPNGSITNIETIRQIALTNDISLFDKIDDRFMFAGTYPVLMKIHNILPNKSFDIVGEKCNCETKGRTVWSVSSDGKCLRCGKQYVK